jgi:hypothetical protein
MRSIRTNRTARSIAVSLFALFMMLLGAIPAAAGAPPLPPEPDLVLWGDNFGVGGIDTSVSRSSMDVVNGNCKNTLGVSTEDFLSTNCGKYLTEPGQTTQAEINAAQGAIETYNGLNHFPMIGAPPQYPALNEGGMTFFSMGYGTLRVFFDRPDLGIQRNIMVKMYGSEAHNFFVIFWGVNGDAATPNDRNTSVVAVDYEPGHNEVEILPSKPGGGWVSQNTMLQKVVTAMGGSNNSGDGGVKTLTLILVNVNNTRTTAIRFTKGEVDKSGQLIPRLLWTNAAAK